MHSSCRRRCPSLLTILSVFMIFVSRAELATGRDQLKVHVNDGRVLTGAVDVRTNDRHLWLRITDGSISLSTAIEWTSISASEHAGRTLSIAALKNASRKLATDLPEDFFERLVPRTLPTNRQEFHQPLRNRVTSLGVEARLANWDADVEPDGFEVSISPIGSDGRVLPVDGSVIMRLIGKRVDRHTGRVSFGDLQRFSARVEAVNFEPWGTVCRFPFQTVRPEFDFELSADALLNVRLGVSESGNFEATTPVRIRHYDRVRDELQLNQDSRFFRNEWTERTRY